MDQRKSMIIILSVLLLISSLYIIYLFSVIRSLEVSKDVEDFLDKTYSHFNIDLNQIDTCPKRDNIGIDLCYDNFLVFKDSKKYNYHGILEPISLAATNPFNHTETITLRYKFLNLSSYEGAAIEPFYEDPESILSINNEDEIWFGVNETSFWDITIDTTEKTIPGIYYYRFFACYGETESCDENSDNLFDYSDIRVFIEDLDQYYPFYNRLMKVL